MLLSHEDVHRLEVMALTEQAITEGGEDAGFSAVVHLGFRTRFTVEEKSYQAALKSAHALHEAHRRPAMIYCWTPTRWAHITNVCRELNDTPEALVCVADRKIARFATANELVSSQVYEQCRVVFLGSDDLYTMWSTVPNQKRVRQIIKRCLGVCPEEPADLWQMLMNPSDGRGRS